MNDFEKNREAIKHLEDVALTKERLEGEFNKAIDEGYINTPTNDRFVVTREKSRGKVVFPLILITSPLETDDFKSALIEEFTKVSPIGERVNVLYKREGGTTGVTLCTTYGNKESISILKRFCLTFKYYVAKQQQREDLSFDELIDLKSMVADIIPSEENVEDYVPETKKEVIKDNCNNKYQQEILKILERNTGKSEIHSLINPRNEVPEIKENPKVIPTPPTPVPKPPLPIEKKDTIEVEKKSLSKVDNVPNEVNAW